MISFILGLFGYVKCPKAVLELSKAQLDIMEIYRASVQSDILTFELIIKENKTKYITESKLEKYKKILSSLDVLIDNQKVLNSYFKSANKLNGGLFKK